MNSAVKHLPAFLKLDGPWSNVFSYHPSEVEIASAQGIYITDRNGASYIDASGGPMAVNLPHGHPRIVAAIAAQLAQYAYCHPLFANPRRAELCNAIAEVAPRELNATYLVSGGSEAVETALKIARQYQVLAGNVEKHKIVSLYESYHGMTLAAMSLAGSPNYKRIFDPMMPAWPHINQYSDYERPAGMDLDQWAERCAAELQRVIDREGKESIAAFIASPVGCGSEYGLIAPQRYWREIRRICTENDILLIIDEVVTGFGRMGSWFATDRLGIAPDMMVIAKGMSSVTVPLGGVVVSDRVNEPFQNGASFVHGFTNAGHPLACAAGVEVIKVLSEERLIENAREAGSYLFSQAGMLTRHKTVADVRGDGLLMVLELVKNKTDRVYFGPECEAERLFQSIALTNGLAFYSTLYGSRHITKRGLPLRISPPLSITRTQVDDLMERLDRSLDEWEEALGVS